MISNSETDIYSDLELISESKFQVYKSRNSSTSQVVALKIFRDSPLGWRSYSAEQETLPLLEHPHIIRFFDCHPFAKHPLTGASVAIIEMEYASRGNLLAPLLKKERQMSVYLLRTLFLELLSALEHIHSNRIAHLDIKLENILIDENYEVKISDFDMSQFTTEEKLRGHGTPSTRAPELRDGTAKDFRACDIYSLGILLFSLFAGVPPYNEIENQYGGYSMPKLFERLQNKNEEFWDFHEKKSEITFPDSFRRLINSMMEKDPSKRPTIYQIRESEWCSGWILNQSEKRKEMKNYLDGYVEKLSSENTKMEDDDPFV